ncbi:FAD/NAD(P)-binding protein [Rhizobium sp. RAF56]|uniref:FAD/NAD(P)-binding protein n=1 Tax=Rhizobium sp. RAF56 TaxID=3233062 RepID=UPI003F977AE8
MSDDLSKPVVAIIGGGFTGAATAYHLVRRLQPGAARIVVFEPRAALGGGLAYDTAEPVHRINVPAARMTLAPGDDEHFQRWLIETNAVADDPEAVTPEGHIFPRRQIFGRYVAAQLGPLLEDGTVEHQRARVASVRRLSDRQWQVVTEAGASLSADIVVIAATHPEPKPPSTLERAFAGHPGYVADATVPDALAAIRKDDRVLVVGAGLTAADVIAALDARGHRGGIVAISRRGLRSRGHNFSGQDPFGDFLDPSDLSARKLLRRVRRAVSDAADAGITWHAVFDRLRAQGGEIWRALPDVERRRIVRFLRPYWDVHRFRIAPQIEAAIERRIAEGALVFHAASITRAERGAEGAFIVGLRHRRGKGVAEERFDAVVVTTGPGHGAILQSQAFLAELAKAGLLRTDPTELGLDVSEESRAIDVGGEASHTLYVAGPLARGTFGELMGLPQVTEHAVFVAERIAEEIGFAVAATPQRQAG